MMRKKHANIPVFIPHLGCPNMCVFCNQRLISGKREPGDDLAGIRRDVDAALATLPPDAEREIAFFGGSFTGIGRERMTALLDMAKGYVDAGAVGGIRLSTRPDYIDGEIIEVLKKYPVRTVELGIQSMDDAVLEVCRRGHTAAASAEACRIIKAAGFELVGQMMVGLPGADGESERRCAEEICRLRADAARVYPTVVFRDTPLCDMAASGAYAPLGQEEAVARTRDVLAVFARHGVPVIRVGLCSSENLASAGAVAGGAAHPALGELAMGELYFDIISRELEVCKASSLRGAALTLSVPEGELSKCVGQGGRNRSRLAERFGALKISFRECRGLEKYHVLIGEIKFNTPDWRSGNCI